MSLIQATIYRSADGLPLSASTDVDLRAEVKSCQKYVKLISKRLITLPDRCTLHLEGFRIQLITALGLTFLVLCEQSYTTLLAFCFLDELQREFIVNYDRQKIAGIRRPYALIEFDVFLQKAKTRYNSPRSLATKMNLSDMSTELKLRPPYHITAEDLNMGDKSNGLYKPFKDSYRPTVNPGRRLVPLDWLGMLSIIMDTFCAVLNLARAMAVISHGHYDEEDQGAYRHGMTFLLVSFLYIYLVYLVFHFSKWRRLQTGTILALLVLSSYYLSNFRNTVQISFHIVVALFSTAVILSRQLTEKLPGYSV